MKFKVFVPLYNRIINARSKEEAIAIFDSEFDQMDDGTYEQLNRTVAERYVESTNNRNPRKRRNGTRSRNKRK